MDERILQNVGLSRAEIKVYLSLLELGPSTSGPIIQKSGAQSSVVHRVLKSLIAKGIVTYLKVGKNKEYQATDPENIVDYIDNKKKRFLDILPELKSRQHMGRGNYAAEMFVGTRAMFTALLTVIKDAEKNEDYFSFSLVEPHDDEAIVKFYKTYNLRRNEKKLNVKVLVHKSVKEIYEKNYSVELLKKANIRYTNFRFPQGVIIFRDMITFVSWGDNPFAVRITNNEMAQQFKEFFSEFYDQESNAY